MVSTRADQARSSRTVDVLTQLSSQAIWASCCSSKASRYSRAASSAALVAARNSSFMVRPMLGDGHFRLYNLVRYAVPSGHKEAIPAFALIVIEPIELDGESVGFL